MTVDVPKNISGYVKNIDSVPLVEIQGTKWFLVSEDELSALTELVRKIDSVPEKEWRTFPEEDILLNCDNGNNAERIIRNCVVKSGAGFKSGIGNSTQYYTEGNS